MRYRRRMLAGLATAGTALALVPATASAAAPDPVEQGVKLCVRQGGQPSQPSAETYVCSRPAEVGVPFVPFSSRDLQQAGRLCDRNGGVFSSDPAGYSCTFTI